MKPVILVIGYKDNSIVTDAWLTSEGIKKETSFCLMGKLIGEYEDADNANAAFHAEAQNFEYMEIKTLWKL